MWCCKKKGRLELEERMQQLGDHVISRFEESHAKGLRETQEMVRAVHELLKNVSSSLAETRSKTDQDLQRLLESLDANRLRDNVKEATETLLQDFHARAPPQVDADGAAAQRAASDAQQSQAKMLEEILRNSQQHAEAIEAEGGRAREMSGVVGEVQQTRKDIARFGERLKKLAAATQVVQERVEQFAELDSAFARQNELIKEQLRSSVGVGKDSFLQGELHVFFQEEVQRLCAEVQQARAEAAQAKLSAQQAKDRHDSEARCFHEEIRCLNEGVTRFRDLAVKNNIDWQRGQTLGASLWLKQFACRQSLELSGIDAARFEVRDEALQLEGLRSIAQC